MKISAILFLVCVPVVFVCCQGPRNITTDNLNKFINEFQQAFDKANQLSGVLYVKKGNDVLLYKAYGEGIEIDTPFGIASITKIFVTVLVADLVNEGKLDMKTSVSHWIPDFPEGDALTVEHLAWHQSGILHRVTTLSEENQRYNAGGIVELVKNNPLTITPGTERTYSTAGYSVLARIIELVENKSFAQVLEDRIFKPVQMESSYDFTEPKKQLEVIPSYLPLNEKLVPSPTRDMSYLVGGGSSVSTVGDLLKFVNKLKDDKIGTVNLKGITTNGSARWMGASNAYFGWIDVFPTEEITIIYLGNTWGGAGPALRTAILSYLRGESVSSPAIPEKMSEYASEGLKDYSGKYQSRPNAWFEVSLRNGQLTFDDNYLVPIGKDRFWQPAWSMALEFIRDKNGNVTALEREDGTEWPKSD